MVFELKHTVESKFGPASKLCTFSARLKKFILRAWYVGSTRLLWGWRLYSLGRRSCVGRSLYVNNARAIDIGSKVRIKSQFILADVCPGEGKLPKIVIGDGTLIFYRFQCNAAKSVRIGRNVLIASNVFITDCDHIVESGGVPPTMSDKIAASPVVIGDNCWLGQNVVVLKGVTIGNDCIIGASSVVTRDVPPCTVVAGNPARIIRKLRREQEECM